MTDEEIAALRQKAQDWQTQVAATPAFLQALYDSIVEVCLQMTMQGATLSTDDAVET
jgi:hypothetical protein